MTTSSSQPEKRKPKSLWGVMGEPEAETTADVNEELSSTEEEATQKGKGLWGVMGSSPPSQEKDETEQNKNRPQNKNTAQNEKPTTSKSKQSTPPIPKSPPPISPVTSESAAPQTTHTPGSFEDILSRAETEADLASQAHQVIQRQPRKSWYGLGSVFAGLAACLLSILSYLPEIYWKLPASSIGLVAIIIALLAFDESRKRNRESSRIILPVTGLLLGIVAMFAGPLVFTPWGDQQREKAAKNREAEEAEETTSIKLFQPTLSQCDLHNTLSRSDFHIAEESFSSTDDVELKG